MYENTMTTEDYKKQAELDARAFKDITTEEKIERLVRVIKEQAQTNSDAFNRINNLEDKIRQIETHEHNQNGEVVVKLNKQMSGLGMVAGSQKLVNKSLLD